MSHLLSEAAFPDIPGVSAGISLRDPDRAPLSGFSWGSVGPLSPREFLLMQHMLAAHIGVPVERLRPMRQVHGTTVHYRSLSESDTVPLEGDAQWTDQPGLPLLLSAADCYPIILYDPNIRKIGVAHAGWRGTAHHVVGALITAMYRDGGEPRNCHGWIGPGAEATSYEIDAAVASHFSMYPDALTPARREGHMFLNLPVVLHQQLIACGVSGEMITHSGRGTITDPASHSYRRDTWRSGRMVAWGMLT